MEELKSPIGKLRLAHKELISKNLELQSSNVALTKANTELQTKINKLAEMNSDIINLFVSTEIAALFLDNSLNIKRFTPGAADLFDLNPSSVGRPIGCVSHYLPEVDVSKAASEVMHTLVPYEVEICSNTGQWFLMKILPYRTVDKIVNGAVLTFTKITEIKTVELALQDRIMQQEIVAEIGQLALSPISLQGLMDEAVRKVAKVFSVECCKILELQPNGKSLKLIAGVGWDKNLVGNAHVGVDRDSQAGYTLLMKEPVIVENLRDEKRFSGPPLLIDHQIVSGVSVSIPGTRGPYGVLGVHTKSKRIFTNNDALFVRGVANILAAAVERKKTEEKLQESNSSLEARVQERTRSLVTEIKQREATESALRRESKIVKMLQNVAVAANQANTIEDVLCSALDEVCKFTGWMSGHIYNISPEGELLTDETWFCQGDHSNEELAKRFSEAIGQTTKQAWLGRAISKGDLIWLHELPAGENERVQTQIEELGIRSGFVFPILVGSKAVMVLEFFSTEPVDHAESLRNVMMHIGAQIGRVLERVAAREKLQQVSKQRAFLNEIGQSVTETLDLDTVIERLLSTLRTQIKADIIVIALREGDKMVCIAADSKEKIDIRGQYVPIETSIVGQVVKTGEPIYLTGESVRQSINREFEHQVNYKTQSFMSVPLHAHNQVIGTLSAVDKRPNAFDQDQFELLEAVANWATTAITNASLFNQVKEVRERLSELTKQSVTAQEEERRRVSRELHDEAGQALTALKISIDLLKGELPEDAKHMRDRLNQASELTNQTMERIRGLAYNLRPPELDTIGLVAALEEMCAEFSDRIRLDIDLSLDDMPELSDVVSITLYRFLQEALTNVAKHAEATHAMVKLYIENGIVIMSVTDNGRGLTLPEILDKGKRVGRLGLLGLEERISGLNGRLEMENGADQGLSLKAIIPFDTE